ncbi:MAG: aldo/keto reductase [Kiritimatiellae bacterium]|nr:aldo/keto reductase [Kiritimatiellia bacterium]
MDQVELGERSGYEVPRVNIGAMRLPQATDEAVALLRYAIDSGMRYIDTCLGYGDSEVKVGRALKDGYRQKVILSTKWGPWIKKIDADDAPSADCALRKIELQLKRLEVDDVDFYQIWNINSPEVYEQVTARGGFLDGVRRAKERGLVKHIGITSHDTGENLLRYIDEMDWCEVMLLSYNLLDRSKVPVFEKAAEKGIGTLVMNPVGGGKLTGDTPVFRHLIHRTGSADMAELAIRYVLSNPAVDTILSGIRRKSDVDAVLAAAAKPRLTTHDVDEIDWLVDDIRMRRNASFCTGCGYCTPCPNAVDIPAVMQAIYFARFLGLQNAAAQQSNRLRRRDAWADQCANCGDCLAKCTQRLNIPDEMAFARQRLSEIDAA